MVKNEGCDIFKVRANTTVRDDPNMCAELENITEKNSSISCVQNCSKMDQVIFAPIQRLFINLGILCFCSVVNLNHSLYSIGPKIMALGICF